MGEDGSVYLNFEKSANTHWELTKIESNQNPNQIQLKNVITKRFLFRKKDSGIGTAIWKKKVQDAITWTRHESSQSNQISLKSYKNDYLNSETDK